MNPSKLKAKKTVKKKMVKSNKVKITRRVEKEVELLPCPFCGGTPSVTLDNELEFCVTCSECNASIYVSSSADTKNFSEEGVAKWNRRTKG